MSQPALTSRAGASSIEILEARIAPAGTGDIQVAGGGIAAVKIGGSLVGGTSSFSGRILVRGGNLGPVSIGGDFVSNGPVTGTLLIDSGAIFAQIGTGIDNFKSKVTSVTIGGSLVGIGDNTVAQIWADGAIGPVKIGRAILGGPGKDSAQIWGAGGITSATIGGDIVGGAGASSGSLTSTGGNMGLVKLGGSLLGGGATSAGSILSAGKLGDVTIGGDVRSGNALGTGEIKGDLGVGAVKISGSVIGNALQQVFIAGDPATATSQLAIKSVTVGGRVEFATIYCNNADGQIGAVKVGGDWIASNLVTGIDAKMGGFGTSDDVILPGGNTALFSKIASITIGGHVSGTATNLMDHFGFVSQEIGSLTIHGVHVPLTAGHGTDTSVLNSHFILGVDRDVTVHEVA